jgi:transcriptional regulator with XRE-family HTH domain
MSEHEEHQTIVPAPTRGKIHEGLERAEQGAFTRPIPKSPQAQVRFLLQKAKGSTRGLAERLGLSKRTVQRYRRGVICTPRRATQETIAQETKRDWQPQVRAQARARAASESGMYIDCYARFGFRAGAGTSDDGRERFVNCLITPEAVARILAAQDAGATEEDLYSLVAEALGEVYFRNYGSRADGLEVEFSEVQYINFHF